MIPEAAVLVIGDHDQHVLPLWAFLQMRNDFRDMQIAWEDCCIAGMFVEITLWLVKAHLR